MKNTLWAGHVSLVCLHDSAPIVAKLESSCVGTCCVTTVGSIVGTHCFVKVVYEGSHCCKIMGPGITEEKPKGPCWKEFLCKNGLGSH